MRPCSGSTRAIVGSQAVTAVTLQRAIPALASSTAAPAGQRHLSSVGPTTTKTTTSARTHPPDHNSPAVPGPMPPSAQRNTAKPSVQRAWLPKNQRRQRHERGKKPGTANESADVWPGCQCHGPIPAGFGVVAAPPHGGEHKQRPVHPYNATESLLPGQPDPRPPRPGQRQPTPHRAPTHLLKPAWRCSLSVIASAMGTMGASAEACATLTRQERSQTRPGRP